MSNPIELNSPNGTVGLLWHEENQVRFAANPEGPQDTVNHVRGLVDAVNELNADSRAATEAVLQRITAYDPTVYMTLSITAAATPESYVHVEKSPFTITVDDDGKVVGLVFIDQGEVTVREDGEWVLPNPEDPRFYDNPFHYVSEDAIDLFDRLVEGDSTPTFADFDEVSLD